MHTGCKEKGGSSESLVISTGTPHLVLPPAKEIKPLFVSSLFNILLFSAILLLPHVLPTVSLSCSRTFLMFLVSFSPCFIGTLTGWYWTVSLDVIAWLILSKQDLLHWAIFCATVSQRLLKGSIAAARKGVLHYAAGLLATPPGRTEERIYNKGADWLLHGVAILRNAEEADEIVTTIIAKVLLSATLPATKKLRDMQVAVSVCYTWQCLVQPASQQIKLPDKLQDKLPSVTAPWLSLRLCSLAHGIEFWLYVTSSKPFITLHLHYSRFEFFSAYHLAGLACLLGSPSAWQPSKMN